MVQDNSMSQLVGIVQNKGGIICQLNQALAEGPHTLEDLPGQGPP